MVLKSKTVMARWTGRTRVHYEGKGYSPFKNLEYFEVKVEDLMPRSEVIVEVECDYCEKTIEKTWKEYLTSKENCIVDKDCCADCNTKKSSESNMIKYGVDNPLKHPSVRAKVNSTNQERYGGNSPYSSKEVRNKAKDTIKERYGVEHYSHTDDFHIKTRNTNLERYGSEYIFQVDEFLEKSKQTTLEKYGVEHYSQTSDYKDKMRNTSLEKYGVEHPMMISEIAERANGNKRHSYKFIESEFDKLEYDLISKEYNNAHSPLEYICREHPEEGIQNITYANLYSGQRCKCCTINNRREIIKQNYKELVEQKGYIFIDIIFSDKIYLIIKCKKHIEKGEQKVLASSFVKRQGCRYCGLDRTADARRTELEVVADVFESRGYLLLNLEDYQNNTTTLRYICLAHPEEGVQETNYINIKRGRSCNLCRYESTSGENHYYWKGGISPLHNHLRDKINVWKRDSLKEHDYKCYITDSKENLVVHHVYNFSDILQETMEELKLPILKVVNEYSKDELKLIEGLFLKKHYEYGFGYPLNEKIHNLFHSIYGKSKNNHSQLEEFKIKYNNGEFNNLLEGSE